MATTQNKIYGVKRNFIDTYEKGVQNRITNELNKLIMSSKKAYKDVIVLCIGTDRCAGDSFAPMLGTFLTENKELEGKCKIYGTLQNPVHARNLDDKLKDIDTENSLVIAVDACLGSEEHIGNIAITNGALTPGAGIGRELPLVGDIAIAGIVNVSGYDSNDSFSILQETRIGILYDMVRKLETSIVATINGLNTKTLNISDKVAM